MWERSKKRWFVKFNFFGSVSVEECNPGFEKSLRGTFQLAISSGKQYP